MKKLVAIFCTIGLSIMLPGNAFGADENKNASSAQQQPTGKTKPPRGPMLMDKNITFMSGSISKIDATTPENIKIEILNDVNGKSHIVEIGTGTNILKVVEIGELKVGDKARIVARRAGDKEVAISVVTGKLKEMPKPPAAAGTATVVKKGQTKK